MSSVSSPLTKSTPPSPPSPTLPSTLVSLSHWPPVLFPFRVRSAALKPPATARRRAFARHNVLFLALLTLATIAVSVALTLLLLTCTVGWMWFFFNRCGPTAPSDHPWAVAASPPGFSAAATSASPPRIAIAMIVDDFMEPEIRSLTIENKRRYAQKWNHTLLIPSRAELTDLAGSHPVAWAKFPLLQRALAAHDFVLMIDADAIILRDDISLARAAAAMPDSTSLLISNDINGPNSGVFMLRASEWTDEFLTAASNSATLLSKKSSWMPLRFENRAFFYLLDSWPRCGTMCRADSYFAPVDVASGYRKRGVNTVDRCLVNRRPERATRVRDFFDSGTSFDSMEGAFIGHAAGGSIASKERSLRWLLEQAAF